MKWIRLIVKISLFVSLTACAGHTDSPRKQSEGQTKIPVSSPSARKGKEQIASTTPKSNPKPQSKLSSILDVSNEWPSFGNNLWQDRFSPDVSITPKTITQLSLAFQKTLPNTFGQNEAYPLEEKGILYITAPGSRVMALNAETGKLIWSFTPTLTTSHFTKANRGVALSPDRVFVLTPDDQLIALQKSNGNKLFDVKVADPSLGYFETMAPQYADGKVFVGSSGGDMGVLGFVEAIDATSGKSLWRFYTIPKRGQGWVSKEGEHGGGAVWTTPTYDPETKQLFFGTGNPSPDYFGESRKGSNLYTDSVVALGATTGKMDWYAQEVSHDLWDYDVASPPMLFNINGKRVIGEAGKDGYWYEWTADDGKAIINPVAFVKQDNAAPTANGTKVWPGPAGGANYGPSAFDPNTQTVFVAGIDGPETLYATPTNHKGHTPDFGTRQDAGQTKDWKGTITAINVETGKKKWQTHTDSPPIGGVTVNAGGVVFFGQANGELDGLNAKTGEVVWKVKTSTSIGSAPILYEKNGRTYLTFVTGGAGSLLGLFPNHNANDVRSYKLK